MEIHKRLEKIEIIKLEHILEKTAVGQGRMAHRYQQMQDYLELLGDIDIDEYNEELIKFAQTPAMDV